MATRLSSWKLVSVVYFTTLWLYSVNAVRPEYEPIIEPVKHVRKDTVERNSYVPDTHAVIECVNDDACRRSEFCHGGEGHKICLPCRRHRRRCHRDGMCCPGCECDRGMCICRSGDSRRRGRPISSHEQDDSSISQHTKDGMNRGLEGDSCRHANDCREGLCCAHHFWTRICKRILGEDDVCTRDYKPPRIPSFQRCPCADGLMCKRDPSGTTRLHMCQRSKN